MEEMHIILERKEEQKQQRRHLLKVFQDQTNQMLQNLAINSSVREFNKANHFWRRLEEDTDKFSIDADGKYVNATELQLEMEKEIYRGDGTDKISVYLASDNEKVKDAFAKYLVGHSRIAVMRVKNDGPIPHAKSKDYLLRNESGIMDLVLDWYSLSLASVLFSWRRDTDIISTFTQVRLLFFLSNYIYCLLLSNSRPSVCSECRENVR